MSDPNAPASRKDDAVSHSLAPLTSQIGAAIGMGAGIVIGVVGTVVASPTGVGIAIGVCATVALAATGASLGSWVGTKVGNLFPPMETGTIQEGSGTVFVGKAKKPLARVKDPVRCIGGAAMDLAGTAIAAIICAPVAAAKLIADALTQPPGGAHMGAKIVHACRTISADRLNAARIQCKTSCGAEISEGDETVLFGGPLGSLPGYENVSESSSLDWATFGFDWLGGVAALVGALIAALTATGALAVGAGIVEVLAAVLALVTQFNELGGGDKKPGFATDDATGIVNKVVKAGSEAAKTPGSPRVKAGRFVRNLAQEFVNEGYGGATAGKILKRIDEVFAAPPAVPAF